MFSISILMLSAGIHGAVGDVMELPKGVPCEEMATLAVSLYGNDLKTSFKQVKNYADDGGLERIFTGKSEDGMPLYMIISCKE